MHGLYLLINLFWAFVFFAAALVIAGIIAVKLTWRGRIALGCVALLVACGVGFSMMTQYWLDHERRGVFVARALQSIIAEMEDSRIDQVCRASMETIPAVRAMVGTSDRPILDQVSYAFDDPPPVHCSCYRPRDYIDCLNVSTAVYVVPVTSLDGTRRSERNGSAEQDVELRPRRLHFQLEPAPWRLVRVHEKQVRGGKLVEVSVWDEGADR
jgi:hypothetical protein